MSCGCENKALQGTLSGQIMSIGRRGSKVESLTDVPIAMGAIVESVGTPLYIDDVTKYAAYGITETGWYAICRITAVAGMAVTADTLVEGAAGYIAKIGEDHVDVAVRFGVAAESQTVMVDWGKYKETFVFKATDLAVRNLDYRVTFYVYDADEFAKWSYALATGTFADGTNYFVVRDGSYTPAEVTAGETIPAGYYVQTPAYVLTPDTNFVEGTDYYILQDGEYVKANVTVGGPVAADTYYVQTTAYIPAESETFETGVTYYTLQNDVYTPAEVTAGETIPNYFVHTKVTISGLVRNVTYRLNEIVDCPMEFILPVIEDETHGAWFEIRCRHAGAYSMTLVPQDNAVIATEHTQKETAGVNMINLHYTVVDGVKIWRFMNTHSSIPTT